MEGSDSEGSFRDSQDYQHDDDDHESFDITGNHSQLSEDEEDQHQIQQQYNHQKQHYTEEDDNESENQDHVNEMSFNKQNQYEEEEQQYSNNNQDYQQQEGEDQEDEDEDDDDEGQDQEMGEMKAKFDKIMANFIEDQKKQPVPQRGAEKSNTSDINDYKNKNLENNMKGIFKNIVVQQKQQDRLQYQQEEEQTDAVVEGPDSDNNEHSVNIRINNRKLFPDAQKSKPPIPAKVQLKNNDQQNAQVRSTTPDREQNMRENIRNRLDKQQIKATGAHYTRPKSAKVVPQKQNMIRRPQTAKQVENKENDYNEENKALKVKKPFVPKQLSRPMTAISSSSKQSLVKKIAPKANKKSDPVSRYQNLQNEWKSNHFLKGNSNKEGRKLDLDRFHKWSTLVQIHNAQTQQKKGQVHKFISNQKAPTDDRRDDLRFQLRAKISQKDYVNKDMKHFHYQQDMKTPLQNALKDPELGDAAIKLEQLKKQITYLRKCVE